MCVSVCVLWLLWPFPTHFPHGSHRTYSPRFPKGLLGALLCVVCFPTLHLLWSASLSLLGEEAAFFQGDHWLALGFSLSRGCLFPLPRALRQTHLGQVSLRGPVTLCPLGGICCHADHSTHHPPLVPMVARRLLLLRGGCRLPLHLRIVSRLQARLGVAVFPLTGLSLLFPGFFLSLRRPFHLAYP